MKRRGILNSDIAKGLSDLGHTDMIMIADCGLPIPNGVKKIDISLKPGTPTLLDVYNVLVKELIIEKEIIAIESKANNDEFYNEFNEHTNVEELTHEKLKELSKECKFIIRTGEITPYANVILVSGVDFKELSESSN
ncbi:MAG: D-ribose pyranase [Mycoplasmatales bacterium]